MSYFRHPKTLNEKKQWGALLFERETYRVSSRSKRRDITLLSTYDDIARGDTWGAYASWKNRKKPRQWSNTK